MCFISFYTSGTPAWRTGKPEVIGGNHDWVEVYDRGIWSFTGLLLSDKDCFLDCSDAYRDLQV